MNDKFKEFLHEKLGSSECCCNCNCGEAHSNEYSGGVVLRYIKRPTAVSLRHPFLTTDPVTFTYSFNARQVCFETETFVSGIDDVVDVCVIEEDKRYVFMLLGNNRVLVAEYGNLENKVNFCKDVKQMAKINEKLFLLIEKENFTYVNEVAFNPIYGRFTHKPCSEKLKEKEVTLMPTCSGFFLKANNKFYNKNCRANADFTGDFIYEYASLTIVGRKKDNVYELSLYEDCYNISTSNVTLLEDDYEIKARDNFILMKNGGVFFVFRITDCVIEIFAESVYKGDVFAWDFYIYNYALYITILVGTDNVENSVDAMEGLEAVDLSDRKNDKVLEHIKTTSNLGFYHDVLMFAEENERRMKMNSENKNDEVVNEKINKSEPNMGNIVNQKLAEPVMSETKESFNKKILSKIIKSNKTKESVPEKTEVRSESAKEELLKKVVEDKEPEPKQEVIEPKKIEEDDKDNEDIKPEQEEKKENIVVATKANKDEDRFQKYLAEKNETVEEKKKDAIEEKKKDTNEEKKKTKNAKTNESQSTDKKKEDKSNKYLKLANGNLLDADDFLKKQALMFEKFERVMEHKFAAAIEKAFTRTDVYKKIISDTFLPKLEACINEIRMQAVSEIKQLKMSLLTEETKHFNSFIKTMKVDKSHAVEMFCALHPEGINEIIVGISKNIVVLDSFMEHEQIQMLYSTINFYGALETNAFYMFCETILHGVHLEKLEGENLHKFIHILKHLEKEDKNLVEKKPEIFYLIKHYLKRMKKVKQDNKKE